jgi:hypothetical protein
MLSVRYEEITFAPFRCSTQGRAPGINPKQQTRLERPSRSKTLQPSKNIHKLRLQKVLKNKALVEIEKFSRHRHIINILLNSCRWDCQCVTQGTEFFKIAQQINTSKT